MLTASKLSLLATAAALAANSVDAHGYVYKPAPTWTGGSPNPGWVTNVDYYWKEVGSGGDQVGIFKTMAKEKGVSVRDVVLDMASSSPCGNTKEDGTKQDIPTDGKLIFAGNGGGGFTHQGPCEIWFDDTLAFHGDNCENEYPGGDVGSTDYSEIPVDYSKCSGDCVLRFYWLAFQNEQWQSYSESSSPCSLRIVWINADAHILLMQSTVSRSREDQAPAPVSRAKPLPTRRPRRLQKQQLPLRLKLPRQLLWQQPEPLRLRLQLQLFQLRRPLQLNPLRPQLLLPLVRTTKRLTTTM